jgi:iron complex transport system permease protein
MKKHVSKLLLVLLLVTGILAIPSGPVPVPLGDLLGGRPLPDHIRTILLQLRIPRILMAVIVGMMLASGGAVVQTVFQNPLADPYIIGISASATFGAVLAYLLHMPDAMYGVFAFVCCLGSTFIVFGISRRGKGLPVTTLLIVGIALSSFLGAFTSFSMLLIGQDSFRITMWMMGYLGNASWSRVGFLTVPLLLSVFYFWMERHHLDALLSGDEEAHALGVDVRKLKIPSADCRCARCCVFGCVYGHDQLCGPDRPAYRKDHNGFFPCRIVAGRDPWRRLVPARV